MVVSPNIHLKLVVSGSRITRIPFLCFSSFTCGLKGLVIFNPFMATLWKAKLQEDNSSGEASVMLFSALRYGASSVWLGLVRDLPHGRREKTSDRADRGGMGGCLNKEGGGV